MGVYIYIYTYIYIIGISQESGRLPNLPNLPNLSSMSWIVPDQWKPNTIRQSLPGTTELPSPIHWKRWLWKSPAEYTTVTSPAKHGGTISMLVIRSGVFRSWRVCWVLWCSWVRVLVELFFTLTVIKLPLILGWIQKAGWNCCPYLPIFSNYETATTGAHGAPLCTVWASSRNPFTARRCNSPSCADRIIPRAVRMERYRKSLIVIPYYWMDFL